MIRELVAAAAMACIPAMANAQAGPPVRIGEVVNFDSEKSSRGWTFRGWEVVGFACKETFTVCGHALRRGNLFYVIQANPINFRPNRPISERVVRFTRHVMARGESRDGDCFVDGDSPLLAFVAPNRRTVRAVIRDRSDNFVEVARTLVGPNRCYFDTED